MTNNNPSPNSNLEALLAEQVRLARKADRRGGCLWNLVMLLLFGVFYLAWLAVKRLAKWTWAALVLTWAAIRWAARQVWAATVWVSTHAWAATKATGRFLARQAARLREAIR
jgi:hypothetical protein